MSSVEVSRCLSGCARNSRMQNRPRKASKVAGVHQMLIATGRPQLIWPWRSRWRRSTTFAHRVPISRALPTGSASVNRRMANSALSHCNTGSGRIFSIVSVDSNFSVMQGNRDEATVTMETHDHADIGSFERLSGDDGSWHVFSLSPRPCANGNLQLQCMFSLTLPILFPRILCIKGRLTFVLYSRLFLVLDPVRKDRTFSRLCGDNCTMMKMTIGTTAKSRVV